MSRKSECDALLRQAESGDIEAQFTLGVNYKNGAFGFPMDLDQAVNWLVEASGRGHRKAEGIIQGLDAKDFRVRQAMHEIKVREFKEKQDALAECAQRGDAEAQFRLGQSALNGTGLFERDENLGLEWISKAAEQGHEEAIVFLYQRKHPTPRPTFSGWRWF